MYKHFVTAFIVGINTDLAAGYSIFSENIDNIKIIGGNIDEEL